MLYNRPVIYLLGWICIGFLINSCQSDTTATARLEIVGGNSNVCRGEFITFDATDSTYDKITWILDGGLMNGGDCNDRGTCKLDTTAMQIASYRVEIRTKLNSSGTLGETLGLQKQSKDSTHEPFSVTDCDGTSTCAVGETLENNGRLVFAQDGTKCLSMNTTDDAACRTNSTSSCKTWSQADNSVCSSSDIRLPTQSELITMKSLGANFCDTTGTCADASPDFPSHYAISTTDTFMQFDETLYNSSTNTGSVRCVHFTTISL